MCITFVTSTNSCIIQLKQVRYYQGSLGEVKGRWAPSPPSLGNPEIIIILNVEFRPPPQHIYERNTDYLCKKNTDQVHCTKQFKAKVVRFVFCRCPFLSVLVNCANTATFIYISFSKACRPY